MILSSWSPNAHLLKTTTKLIIKVPLGDLCPIKYNITTSVKDNELKVIFTEIKSPALPDVESKKKRLRQEDGGTASQETGRLS